MMMMLISMSFKNSEGQNVCMNRNYL